MEIGEFAIFTAGGVCGQGRPPLTDKNILVLAYMNIFWSRKTAIDGANKDNVYD